MKLTSRVSSLPFAVADAAVLVSLILLPLLIQPLRFEAYETYRAALLLLIVALALPRMVIAVRDTVRDGRTHQPWLLAALGLWSAAVVLATVFSLSPARSLVGDIARGAGAITQLLLMLAVLIGRSLAPFRAWRGLWLAGVVTAVYGILQSIGWLPSPFFERAAGLFGSPTHAGSWYALVVLWLVVALWQAWQTLKPWQRGVHTAGVLILLAALVLTGARGAFLGFAAGGLTALALWAALHRLRRVALGLLLLILMAGGGLMLLNQVDWNNTLLTRIPLIARLNPDAPDTSRGSREMIWANVIELTRQFPVWTDLYDYPDRWQSLRPMFGYGLEMLEIVHRPLVTSELRLFESSRPTDRAHNDTLDHLVTVGWFGLMARWLLWGCAIWIALKRLYLWHISAGVMLLAGGLAASVALRTQPLLAIAPVIGAWGGLILWLLMRTLISAKSADERDFDLPAALALTLLTAFMIDLQFSFTTVNTGWLAWLSMGWLLTDTATEAETGTGKGELLTSVVPWLAVGGAAVIRAALGLAATLSGGQLASQPVGIPLLILLAVMVIAGRTVASIVWRQWLLVGICWLIGWASASVTTPEAVGVVDVGLVVLAVGWIAADRMRSLEPPALLHFAPAGILWGTVVLMAVVLVLRNDVSALYVRLAYHTDYALPPVGDLEMAAKLRPWDERLWYLTGGVRYATALNQLEGVDDAMLNQAREEVERAATLNGYDANTAVMLGWIEIQLAWIEPDRVQHLHRANVLNSAAVRLNPADGNLWAVWADFTLTYGGDAWTAARYARQALDLLPGDPYASDVLARAARQLALPYR